MRHVRKAKESILNTTFFNFLLGFVMIISISLGIIFTTGIYQQKLKAAKSAALVYFAELFQIK